MVLTLAILPAMAADYDIVINNGRVMDPETNFDAIRNVGVKDGKIAVITEEAIRAKKPSTPKGWWWHRDLSMATSIVLSPINIG